jgi:hypothetical protein
LVLMQDISGNVQGRGVIWGWGDLGYVQHSISHTRSLVPLWGWAPLAAGDECETAESGGVHVAYRWFGSAVEIAEHAGSRV